MRFGWLFQELPNANYRMQTMLDVAGSNRREMQFDLEKGRRDDTAKCLAETAESYREWAARHQATVAKLTKGHDELLGKREELWRQMIAF